MWAWMSLAAAAEPEVADDPVAAAVRRQLPTLRSCYEAALARDPAVHGRIEATWDVRDGRSHRVRVDSNATGSPPLARCVGRSLRAWTFDPALEGTFQWPFVFGSETS
jgi:hypothetical protein